MTGWIWRPFAFIAYVYAGYPVLLAVAARLRRPPVRPTLLDPPAVTLLIAAHDEEAELEERIANARELDYPADRLQVLVADDGSTDATPEILERAAVETVRLPTRGGKAAALAAAIGMARGDVVVFSDANTRYERDALRPLVSWFADERIGAVAGAKRISGGPAGLSEAERLYWRYDAFLSRHEHRLGCCSAAEGGVFAIRRTLFERIPPDVMDDFWLAMRIARQGYNIAYEPDARSWETTSASAAGESVRRARIVAGRFHAMARTGDLLSLRRPVVAWQIVSHKFMRPLVPFAAILGGLASVVAAARGRRRAASAAVSAQLVFYAAAWAGGRYGRHAGWRRILYVPTYLVRSNIAAIRGFLMFLRGLDPHWERVERTPAMDVSPPPPGPHPGTRR